jgi:hypothetical protein
MTPMQVYYSATLGLFNGKPCVVCELAVKMFGQFPVCLLLRGKVDTGGSCHCFQAKPLPEDEEDDMEDVCFG